MKFVWSSLLVTALVANAEGNDNFARKMKHGMMMGEMSMNMAKKSIKKQGSGLRASGNNPIPDFMKKEKGPAQTFVQEQDVIDGTYLLYSLEVDPGIYNVEGSDYKGYVNGRFCKIDLSSQKEDPSKVPFFTNFVRSAKCGKEGNSVVLDLYDIVQKTRAHDREHVNDPSAPKSIPPTGFLYHEGRCGSTLVSNSVTALEPTKTRTYSEPLPVLQALLDCDKTRVNCNLDMAANLFRDAVYMMGRTSNPEEERLFFKLLPASILGVGAIKQAFPDVPWAFIYRDPVHVMVSNLRERKSDYGPGPYCTGYKKHQHQSEFIQDLVLSSGKAIEELTQEQYCAAYLASLTMAASEELVFTEGGIAINYADMPEVLIDTVFPKHFGLPVGDEEKERVLGQFGVYSKRMKRKEHKEAKDDSEEKEKEASEEVHQAVNLFLSDSYKKLLQLNNKDYFPDFERKLTSRVADTERHLSSEVVVFDPAVAKRHRDLQAFKYPQYTCGRLDGLKFCCPGGGERSVKDVITSTSTIYSSIFSSYTYYYTYYTCKIYYEPCDDQCIYPQGAGSCDGTGESVFVTDFTEDFVDEHCGAPTTAPEPDQGSQTSTSTPTGAPKQTGPGVVIPPPPPPPPPPGTAVPTDGPTYSPTDAPTPGPTSNPTNAPTTAQPTSGPTFNPTDSPTAAPTSSPTSTPTSSPTSSPTTSPTSSPTAVPTTATPTKGPTWNPTSAPSKTQTPTSEILGLGEFCEAVTPVCPVTRSSSSVPAGSVPICVKTTTKSSGTLFETKCVLPSELEELARTPAPTESLAPTPSPKRMMKRGNKPGNMMMMMMTRDRERVLGRRNGSGRRKSELEDIEEYDCGCCNPVDEGDSYPDFCGGQVCGNDPAFYCIRPRGGRDLGMMPMTMGIRAKKRGGVTICDNGVTLCVDDLDPEYLGKPVQCGPCN